MSEIKRVPVQTLELAGSLGNATKKEKKGEKGKQLAPSFRFELSLDDTSEKGYSEFVYAHLLKAAEKKRKNKEQKNQEENAVNGLDPFDDEDDEKLREMAKRFETKYGTTTNTGKNRKKRDDGVDLGAGYDETDSFIDNTDAYDEVVPEGVTTAHGGFYINSGPLEFSVKAVDINSLAHRNNNNNDDDSSESSEDEVEDSNSPPSKRRDRDSRTITSSDEDDPEEINTEPPPPKKSKIEENGEKKSSYDCIINKKKKKLQTVQQALDSVNRSKTLDDKQELMEVDGISEIQEERKKSPIDATRIKENKKFDIKKFVKKPTSNGIEEKIKIDVKKLVGKDSNIDDAIESVVNDMKIYDESSHDSVDSEKSRCVERDPVSSECEDTDIPLPDHLPEDIRDIINKLKKHAENYKEGKIKFFDSIVNSMLLSLEKKLRLTDLSAVRSQVYGHLSKFVGSTKVTLSNRAKKLCLQDAESRVQTPIQRLKAIIDSTMPTVIENYSKECQRVIDAKSLEASLSDADSSDVNDKAPEKSKIPRKKFPWTSETKKLLVEIASAWGQYYKIRKPRKESLESFVASFMKSKIVPLWPHGWMKVDSLLKYINPEPVAKKKQKKPRDSLSLSPTVTSNCSLRLETTNVTNLMASPAQERVKTPTNFIQGSLDNPVNYTTSSQSAKSTEVTIERKQSTSKHKDKIRENSIVSSQHENISAPMAKISLVPTAQLLAQKPTKGHADKFNPMDLTSSSLSITPVNDYQKVNKTADELKKDVVSITPYSESSSGITMLNDNSTNRPDVFSMSNQSAKPVSLKQRILQDTVDSKIDKRIDECDSHLSDPKDRKRDRWVEDKYKSHDAKKRRKEQHKVMEHNQQSMSLKPEASNAIQQPVLSKEEQEQRQIEETMAATNFLSQIINDDSPRSTTEKRKESLVLIDDNVGNIVQPSEQEKDVQMVMRSLKELEELREMKFSPSHSPLQKAKSSHQYVGYSDDYHRLYHKKDDKLRLSKDEPQW